MEKKLLEELSVITEEEKRILNGEKFQKGIYEESSSCNMNVSKMVFENRLVDVKLNPRFIDFPTHSNDYVTMVYVCSGSANYVIGGHDIVKLRKGEMIIINRNTLYELKKLEEGDIVANIMLLNGFLKYALDTITSDELFRSFILEYLEGPDKLNGHVLFRASDCERVQNLLENIVGTVTTNYRTNSITNKLLVTSLLIEMFNHMDKIEVNSTNMSGLLVLEALRDMQMDCSKSNLSDLAERRGVSVAYISRLVKDNIGKTYKEILKDKRLEKSISLLELTDMSVSDIISTVGYENTSYFYSIFKAKYGVIPTEYRRLKAKNK